MTDVNVGSIANIIAEEIIIPFLSELQTEAKQGLTVNIVEICSRWHRTIAPLIETGSPPGEGEVRIRIKDAFSGYRFKLRASLHGFASETGYSGFAISGRVTEQEGRWTATYRGHTNLYNVSDWPSEFQ
jgi:hypothetical protein